MAIQSALRLVSVSGKAEPPQGWPRRKEQRIPRPAWREGREGVVSGGGGKAALNYQGIGVFDDAFTKVNPTRDAFHGEWKHEILLRHSRNDCLHAVP